MAAAAAGEKGAQAQGPPSPAAAAVHQQSVQPVQRRLKPPGELRTGRQAWRDAPRC